MNIKNSVVLVTGANRGLGHAFAQTLLAAGARKVYAGARDPASITLAGVEPVTLDVTRADDIAAALQACRDVTLLINNAGITRGGPLVAPTSIASARAERRIQGGRVVIDQRPAERASRAGHKGAGAARRIHGYGHDQKNHSAEGTAGGCSAADPRSPRGRRGGSAGR